IKADIKNISKHVDIVVVSFHWSEELARYPKEYQIRLAHLAIDNGADLVVGHHPHVIQGVERYKDGIVFYSLGNFAFGSFSQASEGIMAIVKLSKGKIISAEIIPLNVNNKEVLFQPKPLQGEGAVSVIDDIRDISSRFGLILTVKEGKGFLLPGEMEAAANSR
ncbi:MAG: CapA family protein, partial [Deltaproteobacteria bacterium]